MGTLIGGFIHPNHLSPAAWYDFSDAATITLVGSNISQINDKSGNGRNLTQGTAGARPTRSAASRNGLDTASFDGGDSLVAATASDWTFLHNGTNYLIASVQRFGTVADPNAAYTLMATNNAGSASHGMTIFWDDRASVPRNEALVHLVARNVSSQFAVSNISGNGAFPANTYEVLTVLADPDNATASARSSMQTDLNAAIANNSLTNAPSTAAPLGALHLGQAVGGLLPMVGNICEIIIVSGANATAANAQKLRAYLKNKWAV